MAIVVQGDRYWTESPLEKTIEKSLLQVSLDFLLYPLTQKLEQLLFW